MTAPQGKLKPRSKRTRTSLLTLLRFVVLFLAIHTVVHIAFPPDSVQRVTIDTGGPGCKELARHLGANNPDQVAFAVTPLAPESEGATPLCLLDLPGGTSRWSPDTEAMPLLREALDFTPQAGSFKQELVVIRPLGRWYVPLIMLLAALGTACWLYIRRKRKTNPTPPADNSQA